MPTAALTDYFKGIGLKRLLLATDLSSRSDRALERSIDLARTHEAHLTILHVVDEDLPRALRSSLTAAAEEELAAVLKKAGISAASDVSVCVVEGREHLTILDAAEKDDVDLVILGRHRDESVDRPLRGTTMERVLRQGRTPVLVVTDRTEGPYRKVMIGVDFSTCSQAAIRAGFSVAPDADFNFVHAFQVPFEGFLAGNAVQAEVSRERDEELAKVIDAEMETLLQRRGTDLGLEGRLRRVVRDGEVTGVLRSEAAHLNPDLLVIGTHGREGIAHALLGSVAESFLNRPPCDVLAVKA